MAGNGRFFSRARVDGEGCASCYTYALCSLLVPLGHSPSRPAHSRLTCPLAMTSIGTGYDLSASTYSPDGRIFQVRSGDA